MARSHEPEKVPRGRPVADVDLSSGRSMPSLQRSAARPRLRELIMASSATSRERRQPPAQSGSRSTASAATFSRPAWARGHGGAPRALGEVGVREGCVRSEDQRLGERPGRRSPRPRESRSDAIVGRALLPGGGARRAMDPAARSPAGRKSTASARGRGPALRPSGASRAGRGAARVPRERDDAPRGDRPSSGGLDDPRTRGSEVATNLGNESPEIEPPASSAGTRNRTSWTLGRHDEVGLTRDHEGTPASRTNEIRGVDVTVGRWIGAPARAAHLRGPGPDGGLTTR